MNEQRIKELWWKARIGYNEQNCDSEVLAKFAELLEKDIEAKHFSAGYIQGRSDGTIEAVQEAMEVTKTFTSNQGLDYFAPVALARHFGVN